MLKMIYIGCKNLWRFCLKTAKIQGRSSGWTRWRSCRPATALPRRRARSSWQGWKVRSATDRTIRTFAHQNSGTSLSEFRKISKFLQKLWSKTSEHFLECSAKSQEKIIKIWPEFDENCRKIMILCRNSIKNSKKFDEFLRVFWIGSGAKVCESCRFWKMLNNEYLVANIGFDREENEPSKVWSSSLAKTGLYCIESFN